MLRGLGAGLALGLLWGAVARMFMRLLSDDPHFSWEGTLFILGLGAVAGACAGLVHAARLSGRRGWWRLAALPALAVFAGPGLVLAPAAVGMALVQRGGAAVRPLGVLVAAASPVVVIATADTLDLTATQVAGLALMVLAAAPLGWALAEVARRWGVRGAPRTGEQGTAGAAGA